MAEDSGGTSPTPAALPIDSVREEVLAHLRVGAVVLSAPTGTGKSTQVPRWAAQLGRVLVVEPRRVACRAIAARVGALEAAAPAGVEVGWCVRDERRFDAGSRIVFATPGVVLRFFSGGEIDEFDVLVIDEFHERTLDVDLIYALALAARRRGRGPALAVMSATIDAERLAAHAHAPLVRAKAPRFPVEVEYLPGEANFPTPNGVEARVLAAVQRVGSQHGDILVFLPGRAEIDSVRRELTSVRGFEVFVLHGSMSLADQSRVLEERPRDSGADTRIVLSTNVAETSVTIAGIGVVIDSGLVRRTHYHAGRGYLRVAAIACDSARQREGRAGRLGPGRCIRLWERGARLEETTPAEIRRESLVPLILASAACGAELDGLDFLDPPNGYAVDEARAVLAGLGALDSSHLLTAQGRAMFELPIDARLGRLLIEAQARGTEAMVIPLVAALAGTRRLFRGRPPPEDEASETRCDATAIIEAMEGRRRRGVDPRALDEARATGRRLAELLNADAASAKASRRGVAAARSNPLPTLADPASRRALALTLLAAWPDAAYVARRRRREVAWSNGGTEVTLGRDSALDPGANEAIIGLDARAVSSARNRNAVIITAAMPVPLGWLEVAGLGSEVSGHAVLRRGKVWVRQERVYAERCLSAREVAPAGATLRAAVCALFVRGELFPEVRDQAVREHERRALAAALEGEPNLPSYETWLVDQLAQIGLEMADEVEVLEAEFFVPPALPGAYRARLDREFPATLSLGNVRYRVAYDVAARVATLHQFAGKSDRPPAPEYLPRLRGWRIDWEYKNRVRRIRH